MMSFVNIAYNKKRCENINIIIKDSTQTRFVQTNDIRKILQDEKFNILSRVPSEVDLDTIENRIACHSSVKNCQCYFLANNEMQIDITQRTPIARVMTKSQNFYIDEEGRIMPASPFYTAHVPVITGYVKEDKIATDLFHIASMIQADSFWEAMIEQINVEANGDYSLIPRAGRQTIELGSAENINVKFKSLKALYLQIFNNNAWDKYNKISLKYDGQVICTRNSN